MNIKPWVYNDENGTIIRTYRVEGKKHKFETSKSTPELHGGKEIPIAIYHDEATAKTGHYGFIELITKINSVAVRKEFSPQKEVTRSDLITKVPR